MDKSHMLIMLIEHYANGNKSRFAEMIGITPQALNHWISRNTLDVTIIYPNCVGLNPSWLLTGEGEMLLSGDSKTPSIEQHLINITREKDEIIRRQEREIGTLEERIRHLEARIEKSADAANGGTHAAAGR